MQCTHASIERQTGGACESTGPTCQPHRDRGGLTGQDLAVGEVTGGEVFTIALYSARRTEQTYQSDPGGKGARSPSPKVERWHGSTATGHSRPRDGTGRGARAQWEQDEQDARTEKGNRGAEGRSPWSGVLR
jgi:hypothetical protein